MAKLIYITNTSLDGYTEDREGKFDFTVPTPEVFSAITELVRPVETNLYGRRMYETMAAWETAHTDPESTAFIPGLLELERDFATLWRAADKVVYSTTLSTVTTQRTRLERAFDPEQIRKLKATSARDLSVGGPHLAAQLLAAGLVDDLHTFVSPISLGAGKPWLPTDARLQLELAGVRRLGGIVHLHYRPKG